MKKRLFQVNDEVLLVVGRIDGIQNPPIVIPAICAETEKYWVPVAPRASVEDSKIGNGGVHGLFNYYHALRPKKILKPGQVIVKKPLSTVTFDNLQEFADKRKGFKGYIKKALASFARKTCSKRAKRKLIPFDGLHEGKVTLHRRACQIDLTVLVRVNLSRLMKKDEYKAFMDRAQDELKQNGKTYYTAPVTIIRGGKNVRDTPIIRRAGLGIYYAYIEIGFGEYSYQTGWKMTDNRKPCKKAEEGGGDSGKPQKSFFEFKPEPIKYRSKKELAFTIEDLENEDFYPDEEQT